MKIQFNTDKNINGDERSSEYFTDLISEELTNYSAHITRIEVHLSDESGRKESINSIRCLMEARLEGLQPIAVSCQGNSVELSISGAIDKLKASLETIIERMANH
jgi:ribosome-associated translation inhibitor RaiA